MTDRRQSVLVVGGGIAGLSLAMHASRDFDVTVIEAEFQPGYHSSGRSAAVFHIAFENDIVHRLSLDSESFFIEPPKGFGDIASSLEHMLVAKSEEQSRIDEFLDTWSQRCPWLRRIARSDIVDRIPLLTDDYTTGALDVRSLAIDVHTLLDCYRRSVIERGGRVVTQRRLVELDDTNGGWRASFAQGDPITADILVNAAGAWADQIAEMAGIAPIGLVPKRRTGLRVHMDPSIQNWPMCYTASHNLYFKPEGSALMLSPVDATESPPCDAQPEMYDVAVALDRLRECLGLQVDRPSETWAGLRNFVRDGAPVIGYAADHPGFFWHSAFGGFGVQTSPACAKVGAELLGCRGHPLSVNVSPAEIGPERLT